MLWLKKTAENRHEANEILDKARNDAKAEGSLIVEKAQNDARLTLEKAQRDIESEKLNAQIKSDGRWRVPTRKRFESSDSRVAN